MAKPPKLEESDHVLIVEGYSDLLFYAAFLHHLGRLKGVFIKAFEGKSNIRQLDTLSVFLTPKLLAEKRSVGVLLDADDEPEGTVVALKDRLRSITGRAIEEGRWDEGEPRLGFFVAPSPDTIGEIETLAWTALPAQGKYDAMKVSVLEHLSRMEALGWKAHSPDKAKISAYLAAAYDEDPRLGPGAREGKFPFDSPGFGRLRAFLEVLPVSG